YCALNMLLVVCRFWVFLKINPFRPFFSLLVQPVCLFPTLRYGSRLPLGFAPLVFFFRPFTTRDRWIWLSHPSSTFLTLPWLALSSLSSTGSALNTTAAQSLGEFIERCAQAFIETTSVTPLVGTALLLVAGFFLRRTKRNASLEADSTPVEAAPES